jgi:hypothetical protein
MEALRFHPAQFEPTARLIKAEANNFGYKMEILKDQDGRCACRFHGTRADFQAVAESVLEKHPEALKGCR